MKFEALRTLMASRPHFRTEDLHMGQPPKPHELVQLSLWAREGKVLRLKKGLYTLSDEHRRRSLSSLELADPLYRPSYVSLEWALSRYGLIPEAVGTLTSVTPLKSATFRNGYGKFDYRHIDPDFFFGFARQVEPATHFLATPEKAVLDFLHLSIPQSEKITKELLVDGYRLQNLGRLKKKRLAETLSRFIPARVQVGGRLVLDLMGKSHD